MNEYIWDTPSDVTKRLAERMRSIRKRKNLTQEVLAARSNVSYASLRRFESTGSISLESFIKIAMELGVIGEINSLFTRPVYRNIEEIINVQK